MRARSLLAVPLTTLVLLLSACAVDEGEEEGQVSTTDTDTDTDTDTESETGADVEDGHGSVRIEFEPLGGDASIFEGTTEVVATVHYQTCLQDFYLATDPTYQQDGPDGAPVFESWAGRLCTAFTNTPDCEVLDIQQNLLEVNQVYNLFVIMKINDASTLAREEGGVTNPEFHVGPIPLPELAGCDGDDLPRVELLQSGLIGRDVEGNQLWRISTLPASNEAFADQGAPLRVEVIEN